MTAELDFTERAGGAHDSSIEHAHGCRRVTGGKQEQR
jgi:hypothetical protein